MMNPAIKENWCKALESGEYTQCQGVLKKNLISDGEESRVGYCCLGVLCEQLYPGKFVQDVDSENYTLGIPQSNDDYPVSIDTELTDEILEKVGMLRMDMNRLIKMNDDDGNTFKEIAQYLRESEDV